MIYDREDVLVQADSIRELAEKINVPAQVLTETIPRYNQLADQGVDTDFNAFGPKTSPKPRRIEEPPFFAAQFFPITRKSMGGVRVDEACRVLSAAGSPIENLYAAGEVTGFAGINGQAALEGTFLGPAAYMGRVAAQQIAAHRQSASPVELRRLPEPMKPADFPSETCTDCHRITADVRKNRPGYWHFDRSHEKAVGRGYRCGACHPTMSPYRPNTHKLDLLAQTQNCAACHGVAARWRTAPENTYRSGDGRL